jgi:hypothetical protein
MGGFRACEGDKILTATAELELVDVALVSTAVQAAPPADNDN